MLRLPIEVSLERIRKVVDEQIPDPVFVKTRKDLVPGLALRFKVSRKGPVELQGREDGLDFVLPTQIDVRVQPTRKLKTKGMRVSGRLNVLVAVQPRLSADWTLDPKVRVSHRWKRKPQLEAVGVDISLGTTLDKWLRRAWVELDEQIAQELTAAVPIRPGVERFWRALHQPRQLRADPATWLRISPISMSSTTMRVSPSSLMIGLGARARMEAMVGSQPQPVAARPLPQQGPSSSGPRGALIQLPIELSWDALHSMVSDEVLGKTWKTDLPGAQGEAQAKVVELDLYPSGRSVAVGIGLEISGDVGDLRAKAWCTGRPTIAAGGQALEVVDFKYTADSDRRWVDAAHSLVAEEVRSRVAERLHFPLDDELGRIKSEVASTLDAAPLLGGVRVSGQLLGVTPREVYLTDSGLVVETELRASLRADVEKLGVGKGAGR